METMLRENLARFFRYVFKRWDRFAFLLSLYGTGAFVMYILTPTFLDPLLHNPLYGTRTYPLGPWISIFSGPVFLFLYRSNVMEKNILRIEGSFIAPNRGCFSFLSIMVPTLAVLPNFLPEIPHMWIFSRSILYGSSVAFASYLRNYEPDYSFISDEKVDAGARIESVHMTYNAYYIALALAVTLGVATLSIASPEAYTDINEQILLNIASRINLVYMILGLFLGMSSQVFIGMYRAQQELRKIKSPRQNERHTAQPE